MQHPDASGAKNKIKHYWDNRAIENQGGPTGTTDDVYLRKLEFANILEAMKELSIPTGSAVLDVGCGDGLNTLKLAREFPDVHFMGVDFSESMIENAKRGFTASGLLKDQVSFAVGDAMDLNASCQGRNFDLAISDRCLINLPSDAAQAIAFAQIANHVRPGGYYLAIENFVEGQDSMNKLRSEVGLPEIPVRWHNHFFSNTSFLSAAESFFELVYFKEFSSSYYLVTRVVYSALCQLRGEQPDYLHDIHKIAVKLPCIGQFSPIRMALLRRK